MSKKRKGPVTEQLRSDEVEVRTYVIDGEELEPPSSRIVLFDCPFCDDGVKAYVWSLCGGGKRCDCGAFFVASGRAYHWKDEERRR